MPNEVIFHQSKTEFTGGDVVAGELELKIDTAALIFDGFAGLFSPAITRRSSRVTNVTRSQLRCRRIGGQRRPLEDQVSERRP